MIVPELQDEDLLADIRRAAQDRSALHLWWFGQSGFLIHACDRFLLIDPYLSDSLTRKYAATEKPHVRMTERVVDPRRLDFLDLVTSSHNHTDHLDGETLIPVLQASPQVAMLVPAANQAFVAERLCVSSARLTPIDAGESLTVSGCAVHAVPAAHESIDRDSFGRCLYLGYVFEIGPWTIYHSGDTVRYEGLADLLRPRNVDLALLPINGRLPERRVAGNLWGHEAAQLAHDISARWVIPCHYEMFEFNTVSPQEFITAAERLGQPYRLPRCGARCTLQK